MYKNLALIVVIAMCTLFVATGLAQESDEIPTIALLQYSEGSHADAMRKGLYDMLQVYGLINAAERAELETERDDLQGEHLNVIWRMAYSDLSLANIMVEEALDQSADVLVTFSTVVSQLSASALRHMENPPALIFGLVSAPYSAGIASSACIKPDYVTGTHANVPYDRIVALVHVQDPDAKLIGTLVNPAEVPSVYGAAQYTEHGEALGLSVETVSIATITDVPVAVEALADKGVDAILLTPASLERIGLPTVAEVATQFGIPVYFPSPFLVRHGATIAAGFDDIYREGVIVARMLIGHLNGTLDVGATAINSLPSLGIALNMDIAADSGIQFSEALLGMADYVIENGASTQDMTPPSLPEMSLEDRRAEDAAFLAELECTPERIAAEQAALDAAAE